MHRPPSPVDNVRGSFPLTEWPKTEKPAWHRFSALKPWLSMTLSRSKVHRAPGFPQDSAQIRVPIYPPAMTLGLSSAHNIWHTSAVLDFRGAWTKLMHALWPSKNTCAFPSACPTCGKPQRTSAYCLRVCRTGYFMPWRVIYTVSTSPIEHLLAYMSPRQATTAGGMCDLDPRHLYSA